MSYVVVCVICCRCMPNVYLQHMTWTASRFLWIYGKGGHERRLTMHDICCSVRHKLLQFNTKSMSTVIWDVSQETHSSLRVEFLLKTDSGYPRDAEVTSFTLSIPFALTPIGQLHQSPPSPDLIFFLSVFLGWRIPNLITWGSGWWRPD